MAEALDYIPMPERVVTIVKKTWAGITSADGTPVYPAK
jgi:hypothetical protein